MALFGTQASAQIENFTTWGGWNARLDGDARRDLTLVLRPPRESTVFAVDDAGVLNFRHWNGSSWTAWAPVGVDPLAIDAVDAVPTAPGRIDLVVRASNGRAYQSYGNVSETTNEWSSWRDLGRVEGPPVITQTAATSLQIFALGPDGQVIWKRWDDGWLDEGRWDSIRDRGGDYPGMRGSGEAAPRLTGRLAAVKEHTEGHERIDLIASSMDGRLLHTFWNGISWAGFADISGPLTGRFEGALAATSPAPQRLEFFAQLADGSVHWKRWNGPYLWVHDWVPLTNPDARGGLSARALNGCRTDVVSRGTSDGVLYGYTRCDEDKELDVTVTLRALEVHDDCDNVSDGDWFGGFVITMEAIRLPTVSDFDAFPVERLRAHGRGGPATIGTGRTLPVGTSLSLPAPRTRALSIGIGAIDCDSDDERVVFEIGNSFSSFDFTAECDGEDGELLSGSFDALGGAVLDLTPGQWQHGGSFRVPARTPAESGCSSSAYTAIFDVSTSRSEVPPVIAAGCVEGATCETTDPCTQGAMHCDGDGGVQCLVGGRPPDTSTCPAPPPPALACVEGQVCDTGQECTLGRIVCDFDGNSHCLATRSLSRCP